MPVPITGSIERGLLNRASSLGILCAIGAWFIFSLNDVVVKLLSDTFALHQIVLIRSAIGLLVTLTVLVPRNGGIPSLRTPRLKLHIFRGLCIVFANLTFFTALATMSLADVTAIFFIAPLLITALSYYFLNEPVGFRRWCAVAVGLVGVIVMIRPGHSAFSVIAVLPLLGALAYATMQITTRKIGTSEAASTMSFYIQLVFVAVSLTFGLLFSDGRFANPDNPSIDFLFRAWIWPSRHEWLLLTAIGIGSGFGAFLVNQAYRVTDATIIAPFEYMALPLAIFWSILLWGAWPDLPSWVGITLILGSGLFVFYREVTLQNSDSTSSDNKDTGPIITTAEPGPEVRPKPPL